MRRLRGQGHGGYHEIGAREECGEVLRPKDRLWNATVGIADAGQLKALGLPPFRVALQGQHAHVEALGETRYFPADVSVADDPDRLPP